MRLLILGAPASGKTTRAQQIASQYQIPHIEVDRLYWQELKGGDRREEFPQNLIRATDSSSWVLEGLVKFALPYIQDRLTHVMLLEPAWMVLMYRSLQRCITQQNRDWIYNLDLRMFQKRREIFESLKSRGVQEYVESSEMVL